MTKKNSVKVTIVGEDFTLRSDDPSEHTMSAAAHVDKTIRSVQNAGAAADPRKAAILAALQITDELMKERELRMQFAGELKALSAEVKRMLPPGKR